MTSPSVYADLGKCICLPICKIQPVRGIQSMGLSSLDAGVCEVHRRALAVSHQQLAGCGRNGSRWAARLLGSMPGSRTQVAARFDLLEVLVRCALAAPVRCVSFEPLKAHSCARKIARGARAATTHNSNISQKEGLRSEHGGVAAASYPALTRLWRGGGPAWQRASRCRRGTPSRRTQGCRSVHRQTSQSR